MTLSASETDQEVPAHLSDSSAPEPATPVANSGATTTKPKKKAPGKPRPSKAVPPKTYYGRTFRDIVQYHPRTEPERQGIPGFTIRELCTTLHVAAESLRTAYDEPGRLTLSGVVALAQKMGEDPLRVAADLFAEIRHKQQEAENPKPVKRARISKKKSTGADSDSDSE